MVVPSPRHLLRELRKRVQLGTLPGGPPLVSGGVWIRTQYRPSPQNLGILPYHSPNTPHR